MDPITIERTEHEFRVTQGDRYANEITFEEMLGLILYLTKPDRHPYGRWMRAYEEHSEWYKYLYHMNPSNRKEQLLLENKS